MNKTSLTYLKFAQEMVEGACARCPQGGFAEVADLHRKADHEAILAALEVPSGYEASLMGRHLVVRVAA